MTHIMQQSYFSVTSRFLLRQGPAYNEQFFLVPRPLSKQKEFLLFYMRQLWALHVVIKRVFGRPLVKRFALCYRSVVCLSCLSITLVHLWSNGWMDQDETWHAGRPLPWPHCDRWGPTSPSPKGAEPPNFRPIFIVAITVHSSFG